MIPRQKEITLDILWEKKEKTDLISWPDFQKIKYSPGQTTAVIFRRGKRSQRFFTEDSRRYITPKESALQKKGFRIRYSGKMFDSACIRYRRETLPWEARKHQLETEFKVSYADFKEYLAGLADTLSLGVTPEKAWKASLIGSLLVGMVSMSAIYRYLGQSAAANNNIGTVRAEVPGLPRVLGIQSGEVGETNENKELEELFRKMGDEAMEKKNFEQEIMKLVEGYPIEKMVPDIVQKDKAVAAFLISIAKKESNWGKRVPVLDGQDCYNYWGYRGIRKFMGTGGHTCFNSRKDAVDTVAKRLEVLIEKEKRDTPKEMIIWKCGTSCEGHSEYSVQKWISDVDKYYQGLNE